MEEPMLKFSIDIYHWKTHTNRSILKMVMKKWHLDALTYQIFGSTRSVIVIATRLLVDGKKGHEKQFAT